MKERLADCRLELEMVQELLAQSHDALHELLEQCGAWRLRTKVWEASHYGLRVAIRTGRATYEEHEPQIGHEREEWLKLIAQRKQQLIKIRAMKSFLKEITRRKSLDGRLKDRAQSYLDEFFPALTHEHQPKEPEPAVPDLE